MADDVELVTWEGRARMAEARLVAHGTAALSELDVEALRRCPAPPGFAGLPRSAPPIVFDGPLPVRPVVGTAGAGSSRIDVAEVTARYERLAQEARQRRREAAMPGHLAAGILRRDDAIDRVDEHAEPDWRDRARDAIRLLARTLPELTGDDLWRVVEKPAEPRASGAVFRWAAGEGLIAPTDRFVPTTQATSHASPSRVWRSLAYEGTLTA